MYNNPYTFNELIALTRINDEASVERFSSIMNMQYFDASNLLGSLKAKGLIDFSSISLTNASKIDITESGKRFFEYALSESTKDIDQLDIELIRRISNGTNDFNNLKKSLNIFETDLTLHLFKLFRKGYVNYSIADANNSYFTLTSSGFILLKNSESNESKEQMKQSLKDKKDDSSVITYNSSSSLDSSYESDESKLAEDLEGVSISRDNLGVIITIVVIVAIVILTIMFAFK
ncbi:MAG: hypothetical protein ARM1_0323 [Candidatus Micrarchaeota archaeon]|nr:MAG: hypothetical protein ARM1_0323 [Candidatus Micrarchaeota archaeon]